MWLERASRWIFVGCKPLTGYGFRFSYTYKRNTHVKHIKASVQPKLTLFFIF